MLSPAARFVAVRMIAPGGRSTLMTSARDLQASDAPRPDEHAREVENTNANERLMQCGIRVCAHRSIVR
jgi:hypothetical protein